MKQYKDSSKFKRTKAINRLQRKRNNYINDYLHKASRYVINLAIDTKCKTILIGDIKNIKQNSKIKSFVQIPIAKLLEQIDYKAKLVGIKVAIVNENYTSGVSALDEEPINKAYYNNSRRIERGLFKSNTGVLINADINGSLNILRRYTKDKCIPKLINMARDNGRVASPTRIRVA